MASTCPRARSPQPSSTLPHAPWVALELSAGASRSARRAGTPAKQAGPGASQDEPPRAPGRRWRQPGTRRPPGRAHPAIPGTTRIAQPGRSTPRRPPGTRRTRPDPHPPTSPDRTTASTPRSHDKQVPFSRAISTVLASRETGRAGPARRRQYPGLTDGVGTWWPRPRSPCRRPLRPAGAPPPSAAAPRPRPRPRPCGRYPGRGPRWCGWRA